MNMFWILLRLGRQTSFEDTTLIALLISELRTLGFVWMGCVASKVKDRWGRHKFDVQLCCVGDVFCKVCPGKALLHRSSTNKFLGNIHPKNHIHIASAVNNFHTKYRIIIAGVIQRAECQRYIAWPVITISGGFVGETFQMTKATHRDLKAGPIAQRLDFWSEHLTRPTLIWIKLSYKQRQRSVENIPAQKAQRTKAFSLWHIDQPHIPYGLFWALDIALSSQL